MKEVRQFCVRLPNEDEDIIFTKLRRTYATMISFAIFRPANIATRFHYSNMRPLREANFDQSVLDVYTRKATSLAIPTKFPIFHMGMYGRYTRKPEWEDWAFEADKETDVGISVATDLFRTVGLDAIVASYLEDEDWLLMTTLLDWDEISPTLTPFIRRVVHRAISLRGCLFGCQKWIDSDYLYRQIQPVRRWLYIVKGYDFKWWGYQTRFGVPMPVGMLALHRGPHLVQVEDDDICWFDHCSCEAYHPD